jgi:hypothetical protein
VKNSFTTVFSVFHNLEKPTWMRNIPIIADFSYQILSYIVLLSIIIDPGTFPEHSRKFRIIPERLFCLTSELSRKAGSLWVSKVVYIIHMHQNCAFYSSFYCKPQNANLSTNHLNFCKKWFNIKLINNYNVYYYPIKDINQVFFSY